MDPRFFRHCINIIAESENAVVAEIQQLVDANPYLKGQTVASDDLVESHKWVLYFSGDAAEHIKERHSNGAKPGSLFDANVMLKDVAGRLLNQQPTEHSNGRVKWLGVDAGQTVGSMGVAHADPDVVDRMTDYTMPDGDRETVKIKTGKRLPTDEVSMIASELGQLADGRTALSLMTMFPGGQTVAGKTIPMSRSDFAAQGFYFVVDGGVR